jgi:8-oxo-dGTP pyrophosphatase MutT (NUDIX family)
MLRVEDRVTLPLAIAAVIRRDDGRFLLVRRADGRPAAGYWTPVTGRVEPGESLAQALEREVREEVGLRVVAGRELHRCPTSDGRFLLVWLEASIDEGEAARRLVLQPDEVAEAAWLLPQEAVLRAPMFEATRAFFERLRSPDCDSEGAPRGPVAGQGGEP